MAEEARGRFERHANLFSADDAEEVQDGSWVSRRRIANSGRRPFVERNSFRFSAKTKATE
jgi:hypothetical protein